MPKFKYRALSSVGKVVTGTMDDENVSRVKERLNHLVLKKPDSLFQQEKLRKTKLHQLPLPSTLEKNLLKSKREDNKKVLKKMLRLTLALWLKLNIKTYIRLRKVCTCLRELTLQT